MHKKRPLAFAHGLRGTWSVYPSEEVGEPFPEAFELGQRSPFNTVLLKFFVCFIKRVELLLVFAIYGKTPLLVVFGSGTFPCEIFNVGFSVVCPENTEVWLILVHNLFLCGVATGSGTSASQVFLLHPEGADDEADDDSDDGEPFEECLHGFAP